MRPSLIREANSWLEIDWGEFAGEWWYGQCEPLILAEELLLGDEGEPPDDYKVFVMDGIPKMIQVDQDRSRAHKRNLYHTDWTPIQCEYTFPRGAEVPCPPNLSEMLDVASALGREFDFVRVDLFTIGSRIVVGELTHCPGSGWEIFSDPSIDHWLGSAMPLPTIK